MKKIVNRVLCAFMAVLLVVLSAAEFSVVSAESGGSSVGTVKLYPSEEEASKISPPINRALIDSIYNKYKYTGSDSNNSYPHYVFNPLYDPYIGKKCLFDISDYKQCFDFAIYFGYCNGVFMRRQVDKKEFYYYAYVYTKTDYFYINIYCSPKPLYFRATDDKTFRLYSEPWVQSCTFVFENKNGTSSVSSSNSLVYSNELESSSCVTYLSSSTSYMSTIDEISDNTINWNRLIIPFQSGDFPNFLSKADKSGVEYYDGVKFSPAQIPLKDQIEVKLTPEFGLDMDRVFDKNTGQNDYFKFEVTNNSDTAIQWAAYIFDPNIPDPENLMAASSNWKYLCNETYFASTTNEKSSLFKTTNTIKGVIRTGVFDEHLLKPGETFSDVVYWENVKIDANKLYRFNVSAVPTNLIYPSDCKGIKVPEKHSEEESSAAFTKIVYEYDDSFYKGFLKHNGSDLYGTDIIDYVVFSADFSVLTIPAYTAVKKGGNGTVNSGSTEVYYQRKNYQTESDIDGLNTKINEDYVNPSRISNTYNASSVSVDLDNLSIEDLKSYVSYCQSFFSLISQALYSFPTFIWALICFGLTALIVIGIIKALF